MKPFWPTKRPSKLGRRNVGGGRRRRFLLEALEQRQLLAIDFVFNYADIATGSGVGFDDPVLGQSRREALESTAAVFGSFFDHTATIDVDATSEFSGTDLGSGGADFPSTANDGFNNLTPVEQEILTGVDQNGPFTEAGLTINWSNNFALGTSVSLTQEDFIATVMHELAHIVGFSANILENGDSDITQTSSKVWGIFDQYVSDSSGVSIIDAGGNIDLARWDAAKTAGADGLYFNGPKAVAANGGELVPLYSPSTFSIGSSVGHLDDDNPAIDAQSFLMVSAGQTGVVNARELHPIERAMFEDLGFSMIQGTRPGAPSVQIKTDTNNDGFLNNPEYGGTAPYANTFENGTTHGWRHGNVSSTPPITVPNLGPAGEEDGVLLFTGHGDGDADDLSASRLAAFNIQEWVGDYIADGITEITVDLNNRSTREVDIRFGIGRSPSNGRWVTEAVHMPINSGWTTVTFSLAPEDLITLVPSDTDPIDDLRDVRVSKFIENARPVWTSTPAENVPGPTELWVDNIRQSGTGRDFPVEAEITLPGEAVAGNTLRVSDESKTEEIVLTEPDIVAGFVTRSFDSPGEGHTLKISASLVSASGLISETSTDSVYISTRLPKASITLSPNVTPNDAIELDEAEQNITITGTVSGDTVAGDEVTLLVAGNSYTGNVFDDAGVLTFGIEVAGADLVTDGDSTIEAAVTVFDSIGNSFTANATDDYTVDSRPLPAIVIEHTGGETEVSEAVTSDSFAVSLIREPDADVIISISGIDPSEFSLDLTSLTFTSSNWQVPQVVTVTGIDDVEADGNTTTGLSLSVDPVSASVEYQLASGSELQVLTLDNDLATASVGSDSAISNYQPTLAVNYIIAVDGALPTESGGFGSETGPAIGEVQLFAGSFAPQGFAFADGQMLNIIENDDLFSILGNTYGGDGQTTFALPDLRGRVPIGTDASTGLVLGMELGAASTRLSETQLPTHAHVLQTPATGQTIAVGSGTAIDSRQPSLALNYIVSTSGSTGQLGETAIFAGDFVPAGWSAADGSLLQITGNEDLFAVVGSTYGGDGTTNFALPDLSGRSVVGVGQGENLSDRAIGAAFGASETVLTESQLPSHDHEYSVGTSTETAGNDAALSLISPSLAMNYLIAVAGNFPSQSRLTGDRSDSARSIGDTSLIGLIALQTSSDIPSGWVPAEGQLIEIATNDALFSVIGSAYGGDGQTNFRLPDLRGRVAVHSDSDNGLSPGNQFGSESIILDESQLPSHAHLIGGVAISQSAGVTSIIEDGLEDSFTVALTNRPNEDVTLTLSVANPDYATIDVESLTFTNSNWSIPRLVTVAPTADGNQDTQITISVDDQISDDGFDGIADLVVPVTVVSVNDRPTVTLLQIPEILEDPGEQTLEDFATFDSGSTFEAEQSISSYVIENISNPELFDVLPSVSDDGTLTYTPAANANGTSSFSLSVVDDGGTSEGGIDTSEPIEVTITVKAVNDAPSFFASNPPSILEGSGIQQVSRWASFSPGPDDEGNQSIVGYNLTNLSAPELFAIAPNINTSGVLVYSPVTNASGQVTFDVSVQDDGGTDDGGADTSVTQKFTITITDINDQPTFTANDPPAVDQNAGPQVVEGWIESFTAGPTSESGQMPLEYNVSGLSNPGLFSVSPKIDAAGTLTYMPNPATSGSASFTVTVQDDGGTRNNGIDTSLPQTFTITTNQVVAAFDFGDASDPTYATLLANDGPRHQIGSLTLGTLIDSEDDANLQGDGDDGVQQISTVVSGGSSDAVASFNVSVSHFGKLDAWIDFDGNGVFEHPAEHLGGGTSFDVVSGDNLVSYTVPRSALTGDTESRFRVSGLGGLSPTGPAIDGEVEDYFLTIENVEGSSVLVDAPEGATDISVEADTVVVSQAGVMLSQVPVSENLILEIVGSTQADQFNLKGIPAEGSIVLNGGVGEDALHFDGGDQQLDLDAIDITGIESISIASGSALKLSEQAINALGIPDATLSVSLSPDSMLDTSDETFSITGTESIDGGFIVIAESGNAKLRLAGLGWTNPILRLDVNNSESITSVDALVILNELTRRQFFVNDGSTLVDPSSISEFPLKFYDTTAEGLLTPLDALRVLNHLNRTNAGNAGGEPEVSPGFELTMPIAHFADKDDDDSGLAAAIDQVFEELGSD